jgi:group I intron endonuclease
MTKGIYAITNKLNGKAYVGSSKNIEKRFVSHICLLKIGKHLAPKLQKEWDEYGADSFELVILREIEESISLVEIEQEFIDQYKDWQKDYNARNAHVKISAKREEYYRRNHEAWLKTQNAQHT